MMVTDAVVKATGFVRVVETTIAGGGIYILDYA